MPTTILVAGWEVAGLRCPDHTVNFQSGPKTMHRVSLIQMPNGTGKTTTLELLRAALSGSANEWTPDKVRSIRKKDLDDDRGYFRVVLLINELRYTVSMAFDFENGVVSYTTTKVPEGIAEGFHPPVEVRRFLRREFIDFLVFNGEFAERLLDSKYTNAQQVVEDLFQIATLRDVSNRVSEYWRGLTQALNATNEKGLTQRRNKVDDLTTCLAQRTQERNKTEAELTLVRESIIAKEAAFKAALSEQQALKDRLANADRELKDASDSLSEKARLAFSLMRSPHCLSAVFACEVALFKESLDRVKLPESTAREFFEELADEASCVCGRELDDATRLAIRQRATLYLGADDVDLLNQLKGDIVRHVGTDHSAHEDELNNAITTMLTEKRRADLARTERDAVDTEGVTLDPDLLKVRTAIDDLKRSQRDLQQQLAKYDDPDDNHKDKDTLGIKVLKKRLQTAEEKLAEITNTLTLKQKRDILTAILEKARNLAKSSISAEVVEQTNDRIHQLMPDNRIVVDSIKNCVVLRGQEGGSVGENLSVAYAFLSTLFNRSDHVLPFVVDSPANPIDLSVRAKIGELIPSLTDQFIAFTISSERAGFIGNLSTAASGDVQYITLFRRGPVELESSAILEADHLLTDDGVRVIGKRFFESFQLETEDNVNVSTT